MMRTARNVAIFTVAILFMLAMPSCGVGDSSPDLDPPDNTSPV